MKIHLQRPNQGIALIIVLIVMVVFGILAGGLSYSMKVETKLALNASFTPDSDWVGRSGVEVARYILAQESLGPKGQVDCLNQRWAGGPGDSNNPASSLPLTDYQIGGGKFSLHIEDLDRKFNINMADPMILQEALTLMGVTDGGLQSTIVDSILDWRDRDQDTGMSGAESQDYIGNPNPGYPPYFAKDGDIDDLSELLMIRGISPAMYWGNSSDLRSAAVRRRGSELEEPVYSPGLVQLFTALSSGKLNINTASATTLQIIPGLDENVAQAIITRRAGPDGAEGTEDDTPFMSPGELGMLGGPGGMMPPPGPGKSGPARAGMPPGAMPGGMGMPGAAANAMRLFTVKSMYFQIDVDVQVGTTKRHYVAVVKRTTPRELQILNMYWR